MNYEQDIKFDETALDIEWLEQPSLMMKYAMHEIEMQKICDLKKENLDIIEAEIDLAIRENPTKYGIVKIVEAAVKNVIIQKVKYKDAHKEYLEASYELKMAGKAIRAFEQRKEALENLVRLHGQQYFAGPKIPRDLSHEWNEKQNKVHGKISIKRSKRTK